MSDNIIDFARQREEHEQKRKEDKVAALRRAFRLARGDTGGVMDSEKTAKNRRRRSKRKKK